MAVEDVKRLGAEIPMFDDGDDDDAVGLDPDLDEFDLWNHQQLGGAGASGIGGSRQMVSALQRIFLDHLKSEGDMNAAAAKALLQLKASSCFSDETASEPEIIPATTYMSLCDDEAEMTNDVQLDEFDMWQQQQAISADSLPDDRRQVMTQLQSMFLDELHGNGDINAAAAGALKRLRAAGSPPQQHEVQPQQNNSEHARRAAAAAGFQKLFMEELKKSGDANAAVAQALRKMKQKAVFQKVFSEELQKSGDANAAVAQALRRVRQRNQ
eukprot:TRINITY_DN83_c0_g1_i1.p1 TRINITY_DN83_c0_g1~~TRINITY_DN83_c0_g1_i1.p1  ORF type:complete len:269 (-),score=97.88 TRINITY_DN83_c0_g1_i1:75-881(-)